MAERGDLKGSSNQECAEPREGQKPRLQKGLKTREMRAKAMSEFTLPGQIRGI